MLDLSTEGGYLAMLKLCFIRVGRYADEHLLTEIQDPRSDDELDLSDVSRQTDHGLRPRQNVRGPYTSNNSTGFKQERPER